MQLTSVQEAALNACGEALDDIGLSIFLRRRRDGQFSIFGYFDPEERRMVHGGHAATAAEAMRSYLVEFEKEAAKPVVLRTAKEVQDAAQAIVDEYRESESRPFTGAQLDEVADRIAALPIG